MAAFSKRHVQSISEDASGEIAESANALENAKSIGAVIFSLFSHFFLSARSLFAKVSEISLSL